MKEPRFLKRKSNKCQATHAAKDLIFCIVQFGNLTMPVASLLATVRGGVVAFRASIPFLNANYVYIKKV